MAFTTLCVGLVIGILSVVCTGLIGYILAWMDNKEDDFTFISWFISTIGFAACLTYILYLKGII